MEKLKGCCDSCKDFDMLNAEYYCNNNDCPCHTPSVDECTCGYESGHSISCPMYIKPKNPLETEECKHRTDLLGECCKCGEIPDYLKTEEVEDWVEFSDSGTIKTDMEKRLHNCWNSCFYALKEPEIQKSRNELWQLVNDLLSSNTERMKKEILKEIHKYSEINNNLIDMEVGNVDALYTRDVIDIINNIK